MGCGGENTERAQLSPAIRIHVDLCLCRFQPRKRYGKEAGVTKAEERGMMFRLDSELEFLPFGRKEQLGARSDSPTKQSL